jgi:hypothetical protein
MIDLPFLRSLEAFALAGYVPMRDGVPIGKSGVTVATGIDLGQMNAAEIDRLAIPALLKANLKPYAGLTGIFAARIIASAPFTLSQDDADALDRAMFGPHLARLRGEYDAVVLPIQHDGHPLGFDDIGTGPQTVLFSVQWQYGDLPSRCPRFWRLACTQEWDAVAAELRAFGDAYPTRRHKEADYLERALAGSQA